MTKMRTSIVMSEELKAKIAEEAKRQSRTPHNLMLHILMSYFEGNENGIPDSCEVSKNGKE